MLLTPPGYAREDYLIIDALSEFTGHNQGDHSVTNSKDVLLESLAQNIPAIKNLNKISYSSSVYLETQDMFRNIHVNDFKASLDNLISPTEVSNFYATCPITKSSATMAKCSELLLDNEIAI